MFLLREKGTCGFTQVPIYLRDAIAKHGTGSRLFVMESCLFHDVVFLRNHLSQLVDGLVGEVFIVGAFIVVEG